jgi:hypothetical protein
VPLCIICVRLGPSTPGVYVRARVLVPLKPGCYKLALETFLFASFAASLPIGLFVPRLVSSLLLSTFVESGTSTIFSLPDLP